GTPVGGATVDYPGSSPSVVAVGGTSLPNPTSPGTQTGWGDGTNASGGGASALFFRPSWQAGVSTVTTNTRLVPDISSDADPATGLRVYSSASGGFLVAGGTSLAAPSSAAMLTDELIHAGFDWGIGDIHPGLYAAPATDFTDITSGTNSVNGVPGYTAGPGYDEVTGLGTPNWHALVANLGGSPHLRVGSASAGYSSIQRGLRVVDSAGNTVAIRVPVEIDTAAFQSFASYRVVADYQPECSNIGMTTTKPTTVDVPTSDGTPSGADGPHTLVVVALDSGPTPQCHYAYAPLVIDTVAPVAHARFTVSAANRAIASWSMADPAPSSGLLHFFVEVLDLTTNRPVYGPGFTTTGAHLFAAASGNVYKILVTAYDRAGNSGGDVAYLFDDRNLAYSAGWARSFSGAYYGGSAALSRTTGAFARVGASGRSYAAYLTFCSACGKLAVYVNGALAKVVDTYSASARYRVPVALYASSVYGGRTLTFKVLGQKNAASHGYAVLLDAVTAAT
ncbi:MAG TPA: hypothetical protein VNE21_02930, partial [Mycobacteriales bacterium]|nr:hypothetical protein [Mycobacteriales bacterium]